jgi:hypothetical protein
MPSLNENDRNEKISEKFDLEKMLKEIEEDNQGSLESKRTVSQGDIANLLKQKKK